MAETDGQLVIGIELDDGTIKKVQADAAALAKAIGGDLSGVVGKGIDKSLTGIATQLTFVGQIAGKAFDAVSAAVGKAIGEATQAEAALSRFNAVLANTGQYTEAASADFEAFAAELQRVGTVSDDAVIEASTALISIGGLTGDALKQATQAAVDLSAGLGKDLGTSFDLVAKAAAGNEGALARYGIKVDESIPKSERFAATLELINAKFGGLDISKANTFDGALTKLNNTVNDAFESIGKLVTGSAPLVAIVNKISEIIQKLTKNFEDLKSQNIFDQFVIGATRFATVLATVVLPPLEVLYNAGTTVFNTFKTGLQVIVTLLAQVAEGWAYIGNIVGLVSDETLARVNDFTETSAELLAQFSESTAESASNIFTDFSISEPIITALDEVAVAAETANPLAPVVANTTAAANTIVNSVSDMNKKITGIINNGMVRAISQGVQTMVSNITKGKNAFAGVLGTIGSIMGDMAIQIGETLLLTGLGIDAVRNSIAGLAGGPAIAAGIALIAFGSLLKALTGGGSTGGTAAAGQASSPVGGGVEDPASAGDPNAVARNQATQVNLTVQGNVLDRRETGLEIANVLQEYFDTNDGVVAKA